MLQLVTLSQMYKKKNQKLISIQLSAVRWVCITQLIYCLEKGGHRDGFPARRIRR